MKMSFCYAFYKSMRGINSAECEQHSPIPFGQQWLHLEGAGNLDLHKVEMSDINDEYVAEVSANGNVASPLAEEQAAADVEVSQPEPDVHSGEHADDESSTQQFNQNLGAGMPGTTIVMSPADLSEAFENKSRRRSSRQPTSMGAVRLSLERLQLATGADSGPADGTYEPANEISTGKGVDEKPVIDPKDVEDEVDHKPVDGGTSSARDDEVVGKIKRRKSMYLTEDMLKKESLESYKIEIPLRKKVNRSTKKKLWREIERRKPFISENVREHIRTYAKPPFITWGCRNCIFPHPSEA